MKILLLNPPAPQDKSFIREGRCNQEAGVWSTLWPPVTLATAGAILEDKNFVVTILDCPAQGITLQSLLLKIKNNNYAIIAWATATPTIKSDLKLADDFKHINPETKTVVFGTHVTVLADKCLTESPGLDFVIRNEPEVTLSYLASCIETGGKFKDIEGISFKDENGRIHHNNRRPFLPDLDCLPFPAWHLLDLNKYRLPLVGKKFLILSPIRGCPFPCTFCTAKTYYGKKIRKKSIGRLMEEIEYISERFGINQFFIWADTFTAQKTYVMQFCQAIIDRKLNIGWTCNSRVDTVDPEVLNKMSKSGCWMISFGMESSNQKALDIAQKKITVKQSYQSSKMAMEAGLKVAGHFVLGLPGDNEEALKETIKFADKLDLDIAQFYCAVPFPGSPLYNWALNNGMIDNVEFELFSQNNAVMNLPDLPASLVNSYKKKAFYKFYMKPNRLFKLLIMVRFGGLKNVFKGLFQIFKWSG